jgi:hypothetical protein
MTKRYSYGAVAGAVAALVLLATPALTMAQSSQQTSYATTITETLPTPSNSGYGGTLRLTTAADGTVEGWYIPDDNTAYLPVVGGMENGQLWLNVGNSGRLHIDATVQKDGTLVGSATEIQRADSETDSLAQPVTYAFVAKQSAQP